MLDELVKASRGSGDGQGARAEQSCGATAAPPPARTHVDPRCAALLSRIMADQTASGAACVQFVACGTNAACANRVARGTAEAAAGLLGRTLLLDARSDDGEELPGAVGINPVPDAYTPRLYHRQLRPHTADAGLLFGDRRREAFQILTASFRLVVVDALSPSASPAATALAPLCLGSVLVVIAGHSGLAAVRDTAKQIMAAQGRVFGSVLVDVPDDLPRWIAGA